MSTFIEWAWISISLFGLVFATSTLITAYRDRDAERELAPKLNGDRAARLLVAQGYVTRNRIRFLIFAWWVLLGIGVGLFDLDGPPRVAGLLGLVATALGWALISAHEAAERSAIRAVLALKVQVDADKAVEAMQETAHNTQRIADNTDLLIERQENTSGE